MSIIENLQAFVEIESLVQIKSDEIMKFIVHIMIWFCILSVAEDLEMIPTIIHAVI
jgi:hypothetical protein